jgi:hypothetical protein
VHVSPVSLLIDRCNIYEVCICGSRTSKS